MHPEEVKKDDKKEPSLVFAKAKAPCSKHPPDEYKKMMESMNSTMFRTIS
jgi:hypothetical protein